MNIYVYNIELLSFFAIVILILWGLVIIKFRKVCKIVAFLGGIISLYGIMRYTVFGRIPSDAHTFVFALPSIKEFRREMFMNALLFVPFGMFFSVFLRYWNILMAFLLSLFIEIWQVMTGTGLGQGTDIIMNTIGAIVGSLPFIILRSKMIKKVHVLMNYNLDGKK